MKTGMILGVLLLVLGALSLSYQGFTYKEREKVLDIGPIEAHVEKEKRVPIAPIVGALMLAGGLVLIVTSSKRSV